MPAGAIARKGYAYYADQLRKGTSDPYVAFRVYDKAWLCLSPDDELLRRATVQLIESDPWFLVTATPQFLHALRTEDLKRLTPLVGSGPASAYAAMLRSILWYH